MIVRHITQPDQFHGQILASLLAQAPHPRRVVIVSAFAGLQTVMRFKHSLIGLAERGALVRLVIGINMQGTSREVLQELASWTQVEVFVYRHRKPRHTFHPKIALIESPTASDVFVGSNNLTEGGFFRNYEAASRITYSLPADSDAYTQACLDLRRFLEPTLPLGLRLTPNLYQALAQELISRRKPNSKRIVADNGFSLKSASLHRDLRKYLEQRKFPPRRRFRPNC